MSKDKKLLLSFGFLLALALLILNDLLLKSQYPSWITGKLSDFTGLFVFPIFWSVFFPRYKKLIFISTALLFCLWNSPIVQPLIDTLNNLGLGVHRTVDYSDNMALLSLPFAYRFMHKDVRWSLSAKPALLTIVATISILAFTATTLAPHERVSYTINKQYDFEFSKDTLCARLNKLADSYAKKHSEYIESDELGMNYFYKNSKDTVYQKIDLSKHAPNDTIDLISNYAKISIWGNEHHSALLLKETVWYKKMAADKDFARNAERKFRKNIIQELKKK